MNSAGIVTVSYNSLALIERFLHSAVASGFSADHIVVVENCSSEASETRTIVEKFGSIFILAEKNLGYGSAINLGEKALSQNISTLFVCNPDIELNNDAVRILYETVVQNSRVGQVGPAILDTTGATYPSARNFPSFRTGIGHALFANIWPTNPWTSRYHANNISKIVDCEVDWVSGACFAISRKVFNMISGFDEKYFMYFEDVDLGYRLKNLGFQNIYSPKAVITHAGGESTKNMKIEMLKIHHESASTFLSVKYSKPIYRPLLSVIKIGLRLRFLISSSKSLN